MAINFLSKISDITIEDVNPTLTLSDTSTTNLIHEFKSSSDKLQIIADSNDVDAGTKIEFIVDGTEVVDIANNLLTVLENATFSKTITTTSTSTGAITLNGGTGVSTTGAFILRQNGDNDGNGMAITSSHATSHRIWKDSSGNLNIGSSANSNAFKQDTSGNVTIEGSVSYSGTLTSTGSASIPIYARSTGTVSYAQFQTSTTGTGGSDVGLTIGVNTDNAYIWNREVATLQFGTNDTLALKIHADQSSDFTNSVGINTPSAYTANTHSDDLVIGDGSGSRGITVFSGTTGTGRLTFADDLDVEGAGDNPAGNRDGIIAYAHQTGVFDFKTAGNQQALQIKHTYATFSGVLKLPDGSASAPSLTFSQSGASDNGLYLETYDGNASPVKHQVSITTDGTRRVRVNEAGLWSDYNVYFAGSLRKFGEWLATSGTAGEGFKFQNTADSTTPLTVASDGTTTITGDTTIGALTSGETAQLTVNNEGGVPSVARFKSRTNKAHIEISDNDTTGYISSENGYFSIGRGSGVNANHININSSNQVIIGSTSISFSDKLYINGDAYITGGWRVGTSATYVGKLVNDSGRLTLMSDSNRDVQIGSNNNASIVFVDTSEEKVGIGTVTPNDQLTIEKADAAPTFRLYRSGTPTQVWQQSIDSSGRFLLREAATSGGTLYTRFQVDDTGEVAFPSYGSGNFTGTAAYTLAVDSSGNVIETTGGGTIDGSGTANDVVMWSDSDTLTDAPIAISGNNATFVGDVTAVQHIGTNVFAQNFYVASSGSNAVNRIDNDGSNLYITYGGTTTRALEIVNSNGKAIFKGNVDVVEDLKINPDYNNSNEYLYIRKHQSADGGIILQSKTSGGSTQSDWQIVNHASTGDLKFYAYGLADHALTLDREDGSATFAADVTIGGNLNITGDINTETVNNLDVVDKLITVGKGQTEANSNGSGILVDGSNASLLWDETNNTWDFNKSIDIVGNANTSGNVTVGGDVEVTGVVKSNSNPASNYLEFDDDTTTHNPDTNVTTLGSVSGIALATNLNDGGGGTFSVSTGSSGTEMLKVTTAGDMTVAGRITNNYTGTASHRLQNSTSNGEVLRLTSTGDGRDLFFQTDHIYSDGALHIQNDDQRLYLRGSQTTVGTTTPQSGYELTVNNGPGSAIYAHGNSYFAADVTIGDDLTVTDNLTVGGSTIGLYHESVEDEIYFDSYNGTRFLHALFNKNQRADIIRYQSIDDVEYWDGSNWQDGSSQLSNVKLLLDGRQDTSWSVPETYYKFRFVVTASTSWPLRAHIGFQTSWSGSTFPGASMQVEELQTDNTWSQKVDADFNSTNGVTGWGTMFIADSALHTGRGGQTHSTRITIDFFGWTPDNNSHVVVPLQNIFIFSNYSGTENTDYSNLLNYDRDITAAGNLFLSVGKKLFFGGSSHTYITEDIDDRMRFYVGGAEFMRFTEDTADTIDLYRDTIIDGSVLVKDDEGIDVHATDSGNILISGNASASNADQFYIRHDFGRTEIGNLRGEIEVNSAIYFESATTVAESSLYVGASVQHWGDGGTGMYFDANDQIKFKTNGGTDVLTLTSAAADLEGKLDINGTTVIDSSRRFYPASIQASGRISFLNGSAGTTGSGAQGIRVSSVYAGTTYANDGAGAGQVDVLNGYRVQGTDVIDSSRNATFVGLTATGSSTLGDANADVTLINGHLRVNKKAGATDTDISVVRLATADGSTTWHVGGDTSTYGKFMIWAPDHGAGSGLNIDKTSGSLGINEKNIDAKLHISDDTTPNIKFEKPGVVAWRLGASGTDFRIDRNNDDLSGPAFRIDTSGDVGINFTDPAIGPSYQLHVKDNQDSNLQSGIVVERSANTSRAYFNLVGGATNLVSDTNIPIKIRHGSTTRMAFDTDGTIGVGLDTPTDGDLSINKPNFHIKGSDTQGSYHLLARFQAGNDNDNTGAAILINHNNDRGLLLSAGRKDSDREVAYFDLVSSGANLTRMLTLGKFGSNYFAKFSKPIEVAGNITVDLDSSYNIGSSSYRFSNAYLDNLHATTITGTIVDAGDNANPLTVQRSSASTSQVGIAFKTVDTNPTTIVRYLGRDASGDLRFGSSTNHGSNALVLTTANYVTQFGSFAGDIIPSADSTYDLGSNATKWAEGHFDHLYIGETGNNPRIDIYTENASANIADTFADTTTDKSYIYFNAGTSSSDPGFIMHETSEAETNEAVLHLVPSDDNSTDDYVSIHGTNDADCIRLHTNGLIQTAANYTLTLKSGSGSVYINDSLQIATIGAASTDLDKFLVSTAAGTVQYRTGAQVLSDIGAQADTTPSAPSNLSLSVVDDTVNVTFDASSTSGIDLYLVFGSANGGDYSLISVIPPDDMSATMSVIDDSFDDSGTQAYRVYAQKNGVISSALSGNVTYTVTSTLEPTNLSVVNLNTAYYVQWDPPTSEARFITAYNVYKHEAAASADLDRNSATLIYSGMNTSYMYEISGGSNDNFHQFWVETTTT